MTDVQKYNWRILPIFHRNNYDGCEDLIVKIVIQYANETTKKNL